MGHSFRVFRITSGVCFSATTLTRQNSMTLKIIWNVWKSVKCTEAHIRTMLVQFSSWTGLSKWVDLVQLGWPWCLFSAILPLEILQCLSMPWQSQNVRLARLIFWSTTGAKADKNGSNFNSPSQTRANRKWSSRRLMIPPPNHLRLQDVMSVKRNPMCTVWPLRLLFGLCCQSNLEFVNRSRLLWSLLDWEVCATVLRDHDYLCSAKEFAEWWYLVV